MLPIRGVVGGSTIEPRIPTSRSDEEKERWRALSSRPDRGFVHFEAAILHSAVGQLGTVLRPNQTVMVDVEIKRVVHEGVFHMTRDTRPASFKGVTPGKRL